MILREWHATAEAARSNQYADHFRNAVRPQLSRTEGFLGATLASRQIGTQVEFVVTTRWQSTEAIRAFAGDDIERAVVEPPAAALLTTFDREVRHYMVVESG